MKDGKPLEPEYFDEQEVELVEAAALDLDVKPEKGEEKYPGGPKPNPPRNH